MAAGNPNWVKGVSGNAGGRPKGSARYIEALHIEGDAIDPVSGLTGWQRLSKILWETALGSTKHKGIARFWAIDQIQDRCLGKPKEQIESTISFEQLPGSPTEALAGLAAIVPGAAGAGGDIHQDDGGAAGGESPGVLDPKRSPGKTNTGGG